jgi:hypothetical protein
MAFYGSKRDIQNTGRFEIIHFMNIYQYDYAAITFGELIQYFDKVTFKLRTELPGKWRGGQSEPGLAAPPGQCVPPIRRRTAPSENRWQQLAGGRISWL